MNNPIANLTDSNSYTEVTTIVNWLGKDFTKDLTINDVIDLLREEEFEEFSRDGQTFFKCEQKEAKVATKLIQPPNGKFLDGADQRAAGKQLTELLASVPVYHKDYHIINSLMTHYQTKRFLSSKQQELINRLYNKASYTN